jgi:hypothetical protein
VRPRLFSSAPWPSLLTPRAQVENTIEERILQIQKRKTALVKEAFRGKSAGGGPDPDSVENLKIMFGGQAQTP